MRVLKFMLIIILVSFIFTGCETKDKIDQTAKKVEQMEKNQEVMRKELNYYKNKEKETTSYVKYILVFVLIIIVLFIIKIAISKSAKLIKRG